MSIDRAQRPWHGEFYVWFIISFPLSAVAAGFFTLYLAIISDDGLVVDDYYKRGMEINRTLARDNIAQQYALSAKLQLHEDSNTLRIILDANASFSPPSQLTVNFFRASDKGEDRKIAVQRYADNIYIGKNPRISRGKWHIVIETAEWRLLEILHIP